MEIKVDKTKVRDYLNDFDFEGLFINEVGWGYTNESPVHITISGYDYDLTPIADMGLVVYECSPGLGGIIPDKTTCRKIEKELCKTKQENLIIFVNEERTQQLWFRVRRQLGKPEQCSPIRFHKGQSGQLLVSKLNQIAYTLEDIEANRAYLSQTVYSVDQAFALENQVTKNFFKGFKQQRDNFARFIEGIPDQDMEKWYVSVMLNRLMFIYFIQKKGLMAGDVSYLRNRLLTSMDRGIDLYYSNFLKPLFFIGFASPEEERDPQYQKLLGDIPYLNGGLFLEHEIERKYPDIQIKDEAFLQLYDFFDDWRWYLDERPLAEGNEINPDVLGYIFEKYINQKQMGAYYTKEDITEYISKNTIIPYLFDTVAARQPRFFKSGGPIWHRLQENPDRYIYPAVKHGIELPLPAEIAAGIDDVGSRQDWNRPAPSDYALPTEIWREVIARRQRYQEIIEVLTGGQISSINDLITYNLDIGQFAQDVIENIEDLDLLRAFYFTMAGRLPRHSKDKFQSGLSILDPTCGSGAFLFAALNILQPLYEACLQQMEHFLDEKEQSVVRPRADKYADFEDIIKEVNQHRNRRYFILKSIIINNLYGVDIMDEAVEICKLRLFLKLVAQVEAGEVIEPLPDIDFNIRAGNTLVGFATYDDVKTSLQNSPQRGGLLLDDPMPAIEEKARDIERLFKNFRQMQASEGETGFDHQEYVQTKRQLEERLTVLRDELNVYLAEEYGIDPGKKKAYQKWLKFHQPFHWFIEFYGIVHEEKGFDVIIGNPPYVEYSKVNYEILGYKTETCGNLYAFILERSRAVLKRGGRG